MKYEAQIDDAHCVPACLKMILGRECPFTQEEIGYFCRTTKAGTAVEDIKPFLKMMGYRLAPASWEMATKLPVIIDYRHRDGDDHWSIWNYTRGKTWIFDPYIGVYRGASYGKYVNAMYVLERRDR